MVICSQKQNFFSYLIMYSKHGLARQLIPVNRPLAVYTFLYSRQKLAYKAHKP